MNLIINITKVNPKTIENENVYFDNKYFAKKNTKRLVKSEVEDMFVRYDLKRIDYENLPFPTENNNYTIQDFFKKIGVEVKRETEK